MNKNFISALITAVAIVLFFAIVLPQYDDMSAARATAQERQQLLADTQAAQENIKQLSAAFDAQKATIDRVLLALPAKRQHDYITSSLQQVANDSGMQLLSFSLSDVQKSAAGYQELPIRAELSGTYLEFMDFLAAFEQSLRLYDITAINITGGTESTGSLLKFSISITAYSLK